MKISISEKVDGAEVRITGKSLSEISEGLGRLANIGYGNCPMCKETWNPEEETGCVTYEQNTEGVVGVATGLMFCKRCYDSHDELTLLKFTRDYLLKEEGKTYPYLEEQIQKFSSSS